MDYFNIDHDPAMASASSMLSQIPPPQPANAELGPRPLKN